MCGREAEPRCGLTVETLQWGSDYFCHGPMGALVYAGRVSVERKREREKRKKATMESGESVGSECGLG